MRDTDAFAPILLITGAMAAGKSTVAQRVAERLERSVHLRGDQFRRMVVSGRADMSATPSAEALGQLQLRYRAAAQTAQLYSAAGFTVVYQDVVIGPVLTEVLAMYANLPLHLVVLNPSAESIAQREKARDKDGYSLVSIDALQQTLAQTPKLGLWIDSSEQTVEETVCQILDGYGQGRVV